jgi:hypothetical protein
MLVGAVARSGFIGVDVERIDRIDDWLKAACHVGMVDRGEDDGSATASAA